MTCMLLTCDYWGNAQWVVILVVPLLAVLVAFASYEDDGPR